MESSVVNATSLAWSSSSAMPAMLLPESTYGSFPTGGVTMSLDVLLGFGLFEANGTIGDNATTGPTELPHPCDPSSDDFDCSVKDFLVYARGPQRMPLFTAMLVTILFVGILVTGVIGNLIVCLVIIRHPSMRTATNYYLFSLAVSDLIFLLLGLPYEISLYWHQYPYNLGLPFCKIRALISEASTYVSVLTIVAFSMERFLAICHPLHLYTMSGLQRPVRIIAGLWIVSLLSAVPFAIFTDIDYIVYPPTNEKILDSAFCAMLSNPEGFPLWELSTCLFFAFPMLIMVVLYGRMGMQIRSRTQRTAELGVRNGSVNGPSRISQSRKAIIRMLAKQVLEHEDIWTIFHRRLSAVPTFLCCYNPLANHSFHCLRDKAAVVITFFVCWAPFHAQRLLFLYARDWQHFNTVNTWLFSVAGWLYYVSCTINPILYNVMSHRYRVAFRETLCGRRRGFGAGFARDQSSFRETTIDVNMAGGGNGGSSYGGYESSRLLRARSMMQSKRSRFRGTLHTNNSIRYSDNCIRRNSLQIGNMPSSRNSLSPNLTTDVVVMLENNLNGRPRCYTTSATTLVTNVVSSNSTVTENSFKIPLISIDRPGPGGGPERIVLPVAGSHSGSCTSIEPATNAHLNGGGNLNNSVNSSHTNNNTGVCNNRNYDAELSTEPVDQAFGSPVSTPATSPLHALPVVTVVLEEEDHPNQQHVKPTANQRQLTDDDRVSSEPLPQDEGDSPDVQPTVPTTFHYHPNLLQQRCGEMDEVVLLTDTKRETCI